MAESNFQNELRSNATDKLRLPLSQHIDLPKELELLAAPEESQHGLAYVDRENMRVYRVMDLTRHGDGNEENEIEDYWQKLANSMDDKVGLTPKIYRFDPKNYIIEMEFIDGTRLDEVPQKDLNLNSVRRFWSEMQQWHEQKLYHGDLFSGKNYILEPGGRIRIIDPTYEIDLGTSHTSVDGIQQKDNEQVLDIFQRHFGYSKANVTGKLLELKQVRSGAEIKSDLSEEVLKAMEANNIAYVYQRGIGISGGDVESKRFIETSDFGSESPGFGSCVTVVCRDVLSGKTALLHADTLTDIPKAREFIEHNIQGEHISISIVGGESGISEPILNEINLNFSQIKGVKLTNVDILGQPGRSRRQVVVDTKTGDVFVLYSDARRNLKKPEEIQRITDNNRITLTGLAERKLLVDYANSIEEIETTEQVSIDNDHLLVPFGDTKNIRDTFFESLDEKVVYSDTKTLLEQYNLEVNCAKFDGTIYVVPEGKLIDKPRIYVNTDHFRFGDEDYTDLIPITIRHEKQELWVYAKNGWSLSPRPLRLTEVDRTNLGHLLALREEYRYAFKLGRAERYLNYIKRISEGIQDPQERIEIIEENVQAYQRALMEYNSAHPVD